MGSAYNSLGEYSKAIEQYQQALPLLENKPDSNHPYTKRMHGKIAQAQEAAKNKASR